ncbi:cytochrome b-245 light chain-like isoform X2 [Hydra vulgaris]|uniref:Cytochrome b-245 light chain n=1 Tax=Hydra vulgaris TaxID=6087 RepID=A0ABM4DPX6_HYDVU
MGKIEWAMWANEQGVISCYVLFLGGVLGVSSHALPFMHKRWQIAAYSMALAFFILLIEYPRSKRKSGRTIERSFQFVLTKFVSMLGVFGRNYFIRFVFYLLAALADEQWVACEKETVSKKTLTRAQPPSVAPPRMVVYKNEFADP